MNIRFGGFIVSLGLCIFGVSIGTASGQEKTAKARFGDAADVAHLNAILDRLHKYKGISTALDPPSLGQGVLSHVNVTVATTGLGSMGRELPTALHDRMSPKQRQDLEKLVRAMAKRTDRERADATALKNLATEIDRMRQELRKGIDVIPTIQYLEAQEFLLNLYTANRAVVRGNALYQRNFQSFIAAGKGNRSAQEIVDYMGTHKLRFAPAKLQDEAAYDALVKTMSGLDRVRDLEFGGDRIKIRMHSGSKK